MSVEPMEGQAAAAESAKAPEVVVEEERAAAIEAVPVTAEDEAETETSSCFTSDASSSSLLAEEASGAAVSEGGVSEDEASEPDMSEPEMDVGAEDGAADDEGEEEDEAVAANARAYADLYAEYAHEAAARAAEEPSLFDLLKRSVSNMSASLLSPRALHCLGRSSAAESQEPQPAAPATCAPRPTRRCVVHSCTVTRRNQSSPGSTTRGTRSTSQNPTDAGPGGCDEVMKSSSGRPSSRPPRRALATPRVAARPPPWATPTCYAFGNTEEKARRLNMGCSLLCPTMQSASLSLLCEA